jgi:serine/threonine-protein kinase
VKAAIEPGAVVDGKYRVLRRIGEGGMGTVYEGENFRIERRVAIKVLHEHVASSPEFAKRFEREARASARIGSPHVCDVLDLGDLPDGKRFIVMEFLDGESLEDRLERGCLTAAQLAPIAFEILEGLGTMHQAGVIHRDLKPANIFLARGPRKNEVVKILDFGVAKILPRADEPGEMTSTGIMMGTPLYMSPEQARGARDVDGRTDLYAASVIFYRALTGEMPHSAANLHELLFKIVLEEPQAIRDLVPDVDEVFAAIVTKGLGREPDQRYSSAREYQLEIAKWGAAQGHPSLSFAVTLPSEPPPLLRDAGGGFPSALIKAQAPTAGSRASSEKIGPPTPALAQTQVEQVATRQSGSTPAPVRVPAARQSVGTPTAWSEDAPDIAKRAHAELEAKKGEGRSSTVGNTQVIGRASAASIEPPIPAGPQRPVIQPPPPSRARYAIGAAGLLVLAAAALVGLRFAGRGAAVPPTSSANASTGSSPTAVIEPSSVVPPPPTPSIVATAEPPLPVEPTPSTTSPARTAASHASARPATIPAKSATPAPPSASAAATTTSATATPTATTSTHRKFRTNLD